MRKQKIIIDFTKLGDTELDQKAAQIIEDMTGNANFATPSPTLIIVQGKLDTYVEALADLGKGKVSTSVKDDARNDLENTLADLGAYVELTCAGNLTKMLSSGFDVSKL